MNKKVVFSKTGVELPPPGPLQIVSPVDPSTIKTFFEPLHAITSFPSSVNAMGEPAFP